MTAMNAATTTIANGATDSSTITLGSGTTNDNIKTLQGFVMPAAFTGASVSFKVSLDGTNFYPLYDSTNSLVSITVAASRAYTLPADTFNGWPYMKIVSGASEAAQRTITVSMFDV